MTFTFGDLLGIIVTLILFDLAYAVVFSFFHRLSQQWWRRKKEDVQT